jgi:hypothetical protein
MRRRGPYHYPRAPAVHPGVDPTRRRPSVAVDLTWRRCFRQVRLAARRDSYGTLGGGVAGDGIAAGVKRNQFAS